MTHPVYAGMVKEIPPTDSDGAFRADMRPVGMLGGRGSAAGPRIPRNVAAAP